MEKFIAARTAGSGGGIPARTAGSRPVTPAIGVELITPDTGPADIPTGAGGIRGAVASGLAGVEAAMTGDTGTVPAGVVMAGAGTGDIVITLARLAAREAGSGWGMPAITAGSRTESGGEAGIIS